MVYLKLLDRTPYNNWMGRPYENKSSVEWNRNIIEFLV